MVVLFLRLYTLYIKKQEWFWNPEPWRKLSSDGVLIASLRGESNYVRHDFVGCLQTALCVCTVFGHSILAHGSVRCGDGKSSVIIYLYGNRSYGNGKSTFLR